jgi:hypothetical protein
LGKAAHGFTGAATLPSLAGKLKRGFFIVARFHQETVSLVKRLLIAFRNRGRKRK